MMGRSAKVASIGLFEEGEVELVDYMEGEVSLSLFSGSP